MTRVLLLLVCVILFTVNPTSAAVPTIAPTPTQPPPVIIPFVEINDYFYATLDQIFPNVTNNPAAPGFIACSTTTFRKPPAGGWVIAPATFDAITAATSFSWGSAEIVLADGSSYFTSSPRTRSQTSGQLQDNGSGAYAPATCSPVQRILMRSPTTTIPVSSFYFTFAPVPTLGTASRVTKAPAVTYTPQPYYTQPPTPTMIMGTLDPSTFENTVPLGVANFTYPDNSTTSAPFTSRPTLSQTTTSPPFTLTTSSPHTTLPPAQYTTRPGMTMAPTPASFPASQLFIINGVQYTTLDGAGPRNGLGDACNETIYHTVPGGWTLVNRTQDALSAIAAGAWSTYRMVLSDGSTWDTGKPHNLTSPGDPNGGLLTDGKGGYAPSYCDMRILIQSPAAPRPTVYYTVSPAKVVIYRGYQYAVLDGAGPDDFTGPICDVNNFLQLPAGWSLAPPTNDSVKVISTHPWATYGVVLSDGSAYASDTNNIIFNTTIATNVLTDDYQGGYGVQFCDLRILIFATAPYVPPPPTNFTVGMKVLVVALYNNLAEDYRLSSIVTTLRSLAIPFDIYVSSATHTTCNPSPPVMESGENAGMYYAIAMTGFQLLLADGTNCAPMQQIRAYQTKYRVRLFSGFSDSGSCCTSAVGPYNNPNITIAYLKLDPDLPITMGQGLNRSVSLRLNSLEDSFYLAEIADPSVATPVLRYTLNAGDTPSPSDYVASLILNSDYGEEYHTFYDNSEYLMSSGAFGDLWATWLVKDLYFGMRRNFLNPQADDLVIATTLFNLVRQTPGIFGDPAYRATGEDMDLLSDYQIAANTKYSSYVRVMFPINGVGLYNFDRVTLLANDSLRLSAQVHAKNLDFFFVSHTWTHMDMTCINTSCTKYLAKSYEAFRSELSGGATNYSQVLTEFSTNANAIYNDMFPPSQFTEIEFKKAYSNKTLVNPRISGLFNPNAVKAMTDFGIEVIVGDNTRNELLPYPEYLNDPFDWPPAAYQDRSDPRYIEINFYHGRWLTREVNGYSDNSTFWRQIFMIPRFSTDIFFDCSTFEEDIGEYNVIHPDAPKTMEELYANEVFLTTLSMLQHKWDPYMFHQANIRKLNATDGSGSTTSLVQRWIDEVLASFRLYSTLPIISLDLEELGAIYIERMEREVDCQFTNTMTVVDGQVESITFQSARQSPNGCYVRLTGLSLSDLSSPPVGATEEAWGPDNTIKFMMPGSQWPAPLPAGYAAPPAYLSETTVSLNPGAYQWSSS